jgi:small-conductance mechanosensitive channel
MVVYNNVTLLDLIYVFIVFMSLTIIAKTLVIYMRRSFKGKIPKDQISMLSKIIHLVSTILALVIILPILGFNPTGLLVAGGFVALAIGLAAQSVIGNLLSGILLLVERPMKVGDTVEIDGVSGSVEDVQIISTTIKTFSGIYVRFPNDKVFSNTITNYSVNVARRFVYNVGIRYVDDADKAADIIKKLADEHPLVLANPAPQVYVEELGDNSVNLAIKMWGPVKNGLWWDINTELLWKIKSELEQNGIQIPFPQRVVWQQKD